MAEIDENARLWKLMGMMFRSHPWHGVAIGSQWPEVVTTYIEIVPTDTVKYEIDKTSGILKIDRPQLFSNITPSLYGFIPQTYCAERVAELCRDRTGRAGIVGDGDPLDICVLSEKTITHGNILLQAIPIGGLRMIDGDEADDKIIAVMKGDAAYGGWRDISECPASLVERLRHYFLTYKTAPGAATSACEITHIYDRGEAHECIRRSRDDYLAHYGEIEEVLAAGFDR
ncbi:MAG TPA: inorganic pyrophosphatase [Blastocatellia bacterium]|nr:inorganic pyrophosphatase [Blastocatellia bacterium]